MRGKKEKSRLKDGKVHSLGSHKKKKWKTVVGASDRTWKSEQAKHYDKRLLRTNYKVPLQAIGVQKKLQYHHSKDLNLITFQP